MKALFAWLALAASASAWAQAPGLRGTVTDASGAVVSGAQIQLRGPGREWLVKSDAAGQYSVAPLPAGAYQVRITAKGFTAAEKRGLEIAEPRILDIRLAIHGEAQVITVRDEPRSVGTAPDANASRVLLRERQLAALSDDPDELALQLQALAGPAPGPGGGEIFIDGFSGARLPPKASIREVRINANPFSPEYDRPGFSRIEVFTKPGSDSQHGQALAQYNDQRLNARNPLLAQATRPPYRAQVYTLNLTGPIVRNRASFTFDGERRDIGENAFVLATTLDADLNPLPVNQVLAAPQTRTVVNPRLDFAINPKNTLAVRFQALRLAYENQGVGDFNLPSRAYDERQRDETLQATETAVVSARTINESRFQFLRSSLRYQGASDAPAITVQGAFAGGGAPVGDSGSRTANYEFSNVTFHTRGKNALKWGGRWREARLDDRSVANFAGTYIFYSLAQYQATLLGQDGAMPSQFTRNAGNPEAAVNQRDAGLFFSDDWRLRPNLTLSYGVRYEVQSNLGGRGDWAPRVGIACGLGAKGGSPARTVLRAGFGEFLDRIPLNVTLNNMRFDGVQQQSYQILGPAFFPSVPPPALLEASRQPQQLRPVFGGITAPQVFQASAGVEQQLNAGSRVSLTWIASRGVHLLNLRNVNAPVQGGYPMGDRSIRLLTESAGLSRLQQLVAGANVSYRKLYFYGSYTLSYGMANNEGIPANPYDLRAEWSPASYGDVRHRLAGGVTAPLPRGFSLSVFLLANSGIPYNITTGLDPYATGFPAARPALLRGVGAAQCSDKYVAGFGCFVLNPAPGVPAIGRNAARGPASWNQALRFSRTWNFGAEGGASVKSGGGGHDGAPQGAIPDSAGTRRYRMVMSASTLNALNRANYAPPNGVLTSPYFGQYRALGGLAVMSHGGAPGTFNRKIDLQVQFSW
ncbi:MAG: carboxypeptidase regulatory-like domain-containing protein [Candidatus Solibacter sp.]